MMYLVSALVENSSSYGHRSAIIDAKTRAEAVGVALESFQVGEWAVVSYSVSDCPKLTQIQHKNRVERAQAISKDWGWQYDELIEELKDGGSSDPLRNTSATQCAHAIITDLTSLPAP